MDNITEKQNSKSEKLNQLDPIEILRIINDEDKKVAVRVSEILPEINYLILDIIKKMKKGGRLFYVGCGTSGRLGVLDASECPPTFGVEHDLVQGIIAGGYKALSKSIENAEDSFNDGFNIISKKNISELDTVIGISASGTAPYVHGALSNSSEKGATTALICCNNHINHNIDHLLSIVVGPEVVTGSTRMKAGTATKMILNMISTTVMVKLNKVFGNLMIDLKLNNKKLVNRSISIISKIARIDKNKAKTFLKKADGNIKVAIIMSVHNKSFKEAINLLQKYNGNLEQII
tara:strand:- start:21523 stop:22395 length:873 start_codon:yes stop_codon:yes gene_type:complete